MSILIYRPDEGDEVLSEHWSYLTRALQITGVSQLSDIGATPVVVVQPEDARYVRGEISLLDFEHPDHCCYLFGASNALMREEMISDLNVIARVYIPTAPTWELYSSQAAAIVLWDRVRQRGGSLG